MGKSLTGSFKLLIRESEIVYNFCSLKKSLTKYIIVAVSVPAVLEWLRLRCMTLNLAYFEIKFDPA